MVSTFISALFRFHNRAIELVELFKSEYATLEAKRSALSQFQNELSSLEHTLKDQFGEDANVNYILSHIRSLVASLNLEKSANVEVEFKDCLPVHSDYNEKDKGQCNAYG